MGQNSNPAYNIPAPSLSDAGIDNVQLLSKSMETPPCDNVVVERLPIPSTTSLIVADRSPSASDSTNIGPIIPALVCP